MGTGSEKKWAWRIKSRVCIPGKYRTERGIGFLPENSGTEDLVNALCSTPQAENMVLLTQGDRIVAEYSNGLWYSGCVYAVKSWTVCDIEPDDGRVGGNILGWTDVPITRVLK